MGKKKADFSSDELKLLEIAKALDKIGQYDPVIFSKEMFYMDPTTGNHTVVRKSRKTGRLELHRKDQRRAGYHNRQQIYEIPPELEAGYKAMVAANPHLFDETNDYAAFERYIIDGWTKAKATASALGLQAGHPIPPAVAGKGAEMTPHDPAGIAPERGEDYTSFEGDRVTGNQKKGNRLQLHIAFDEMRKAGLPITWLESAARFATKQSGINVFNFTSEDIESLRLGANADLVVARRDAINQGLTPPELNPDAKTRIRPSYADDTTGVAPETNETEHLSNYGRRHQEEVIASSKEKLLNEPGRGEIISVTDERFGRERVSDPPDIETQAQRLERNRNWLNNNEGMNFNSYARGARRTGNIANLATAAAYGSSTDVALAAGNLTLAEVIQNPTVQKNVGKQIAELVSERGAKSAAKLIPGLDIILSAWESGEYLSQGKLDQAGIALLSGAIGWVPVIGDAASATLDLSNTARDIAGVIEQNQPGYEPPPEPEPLDYTEYNQLTNPTTLPTPTPSIEPKTVKKRVWDLNNWMELTQQ